MINMAFAFLCFTGVMVMLLYLMRSLEKFQEQMRDEHAQLRVQIRALEARLEARPEAPAGQDGQGRILAPLPVTDPEAPLLLGPKDPLDVALEDPLMRFEPQR